MQSKIAERALGTAHTNSWVVKPCSVRIAAIRQASKLLRYNRRVQTHAVESIEFYSVATQSDIFSDSLFAASQSADALVASQLAGVTPLTYLVCLGAGLVTSLSPCTLSVLPLTIGYIGGYSQNGVEKPNLTVQAVSFSLGLASTLAALGVVSSLAGRTYGSMGGGAEGVPLVVGAVAVAMGLNLLEVLPLRLPSVDLDVRAVPVPPALQAYLAGATFALAASPCSTPVLATLLAYVSSTRDPLQGGALLLAYTTGYVAPLLLAASATGVVKQLLALRQYSAWVTPASGVLLVAGGTYTLLSRLLP